MSIDEVADIFQNIADGFEDACIECLGAHTDIVVWTITEQLYSGLDGEGQYLSPTYDDDPYFDKPDTPWYHRAKAYKQWKYDITPPQASSLLTLPPRPVNVPNLFINGTFFSTITAYVEGDTLVTTSSRGDGPEIVAKYGDQILSMGQVAKDYFNEEYMLPAIDAFLKKCGYS